MKDQPNGTVTFEPYKIYGKAHLTVVRATRRHIWVDAGGDLKKIRVGQQMIFHVVIDATPR